MVALWHVFVARSTLPQRPDPDGGDDLARARTASERDRAALRFAKDRDLGRLEATLTRLDAGAAAAVVLTTDPDGRRGTRIFREPAECPSKPGATTTAQLVWVLAAQLPGPSSLGDTVRPWASRSVFSVLGDALDEGPHRTLDPYALDCPPGHARRHRQAEQGGQQKDCNFAGIELGSDPPEALLLAQVDRDRLWRAGGNTAGRRRGSSPLSFCRGTGVARSSSRKTSGGPYRVQTTAFNSEPPRPADPRAAAPPADLHRGRRASHP
jgi:hypothetical protein